MNRVAYSCYITPLDDAEVNSGEIITEQSGYRTTAQQVRELQLSGERLIEYQRNLYKGYEFARGTEITDEVVESAIDSSLVKNSDPVDRINLQKRVDTWLEEHKPDKKKQEPIDVPPSNLQGEPENEPTSPPSTFPNEN